MEDEFDFYKHFAWLRKVNHQSSDNSESYQERLSRLEGDKESLILQVGVLTDQVEAQEVKISDLQSSVVEHRLKLNATEEMLQQELLHRTTLEKQKLSLKGEVSYLKLKLTDMEEKPGHGGERQHKAESVVNFISELQEQMCRFQKEINSKIQEKKASENPADSRSAAPCSAPSTSPEDANPSCYTAAEVKPKLEEEATDGVDESSSDAEQLPHGGESGLVRELKTLKDKMQHLEDEKMEYEKRLKASKVEISSLQELLLSKNVEIESLHTQLLARPSLATESSERDQELQRLRSDIKTLEVANDEKDRRIEELTLLLNQCKQFRDLTHNARQAPPAGPSLSNGRTNSSSSEEEEHGLRKNADSASAKSEDLKSDVSTNSASSHQTSILSQKDSDCRIETQTSSSSMTDLTPGQTKRRDTRSPTLPVRSSPTESSAELQSERSPDDSEDGDCSQTKLDKVNTCTGKTNPPGQRNVGSPEYMKTNRSLKRLWGKLRRTNSGGVNVGDPDTGPFRRGGFRATAGPRLTRNPESPDSVRDMNLPFSQWTKEQVCGWLEDYGLGHYVNLTRQWVECGQTLLSATPQDLEKEMGIKHPLHRKKLQLALKAFASKLTEKSAELDHIWVTRWLDDIGLPQYKDQFHEARVDGRMIQYLTVNDLLSLKVTSQLHHLSIKCAIHVLHANKFNPHCLRRRPGEEWTLQYESTRWRQIHFYYCYFRLQSCRTFGSDNSMPPSLWELLGEVVVHFPVYKEKPINGLLVMTFVRKTQKASPDLNPSNACGMKYNRNDELGSKQPSPSEVVQWSNHRVMEWLRAVDLAEYAPNLRGSGVHGGLIILEPRFSAETLALLLNIPPQKTLLRRHLATAFSALVGTQATQEKREYGNATGHVPLTTTSKVKPKKLGFTQFSHLRKRKPDESADYICPIEGGLLTVNGISRTPSAALRGISPNLDTQPKKHEHGDGKLWRTNTNNC